MSMKEKEILSRARGVRLSYMLPYLIKPEMKDLETGLEQRETFIFKGSRLLLIRIELLFEERPSPSLEVKESAFELLPYR